jgi:hypothetical protein
VHAVLVGATHIYFNPFALSPLLTLFKTVVFPVPANPSILQDLPDDIIVSLNWSLSPSLNKVHSFGSYLNCSFH